MTPELKNIIEKWASYESPYISRSYGIKKNDEEKDIIQFTCSFHHETVFELKSNNYDLTIGIVDPELLTKHMNNFWIAFISGLILHLEENWTSFSKEMPEEGETVELAIIPTITPKVEEFSSKVYFAMALYNGSYFQCHDRPVHNILHNNLQAKKIWKMIDLDL